MNLTINFPKNKFKLNTSLASFIIASSLLLPCNVLADIWIEGSNYDISWYDSGYFNYNLSTAEDFAGLAYLVNHDNIIFAGKNLDVQNNISLVDHDWILIKNIFAGNICGGHRVLLNKNSSSIELFES